MVVLAGIKSRKGFGTLAPRKVSTAASRKALRAEEPQRGRIEIAVDLDVRSPIADVCCLNDKSVRQFPLNPEFPALHLSGLWIAVEEGNCISDVCLKTSTGSHRLLDAVREWIRERIDKRETVAAERNERSVLAKAEFGLRRRDVGPGSHNKFHSHLVPPSCYLR